MSKNNVCAAKRELIDEIGRASREDLEMTMTRMAIAMSNLCVVLESYIGRSAVLKIVNGEMSDEEMNSLVGPVDPGEEVER